jgi:hypothetical protein
MCKEKNSDRDESNSIFIAATVAKHIVKVTKITLM